jgi:mannose-1-phosphate guanylyltransferase / mannose-6-phosphate isomerase
VAQITADLVLEPCGRNTCAAALAGALQAQAREPGAFVLVLASDQLIDPVLALHDAVREALACVALDYIVTFGVQPNHPSSDFGYVVPGAVIAGSNCQTVKLFVEKPDGPQAQALMAEGALWNSGNFLVRAAQFCATAAALAPASWQAVSKAFAAAARQADRIVLEVSAFAAAPREAVDVAILEKAGKVAVLPVSFQWCDLGTWAAVEANLSR